VKVRAKRLSSVLLAFYLGVAMIQTLALSLPRHLLLVIGIYLVTVAWAWVVLERWAEPGRGGLARLIGLRDPFPGPRQWLQVAVMLIAMWLAYLAVAALLLRLGWPFDTGAPLEQLNSLRRGTWSSAALFFVLIGVAPLFEEAFFRAFLQRELVGLTSPVTGVLTAAMAFALLHPLPVLPLTFVMGIMLGISYRLSGVLCVPVGVHALWNLGVLILTIGVV